MEGMQPAPRPPPAGDTLAAMIESLRVEPGTPARIAERDPRDTLGLDKARGHELLDELSERLDVLRYRLYAEGARSVLLVLQGLDASGKDGVIRSVFAGVSPQGCRVVSFRVPAPNELAHDYLWRIHGQMPARGELGVFNRSHYEDVVAVRMHRLAPEDVWRRRPGHIREWERMLSDEGTTIVKVFLNVSKEEQRQRLQERISDPEKRWKFRRDDLKVRKRFDEYIAAYEEVLTETSTGWAPWYVVPADRNWVKSLAVARLLVDELERIDPQLPAPEKGIEKLVIE
jgi:PPK2 family polyphosphate:nucleotide phosphotransferase